MSTGSELYTNIVRMRKRPADTATLAATLQVPFGDDTTAPLLVPVAVDLYSYNMNSTDKADKLYAYYTTSARYRKAWITLCHPSFEKVILNYLKLSIWNATTESRWKRSI